MGTQKGEEEAGNKWTPRVLFGGDLRGLQTAGITQESEAKFKLISTVGLQSGLGVEVNWGEDNVMAFSHGRKTDLA